MLPDITVFGLKIHSHSYSTSRVSQCVSSYGAIGVEHYEVPPDFNGNVPLYPYTSGIGRWTRGPQWPVVNDRFQCMGITGQANRGRQKSTRLSSSKPSGLKSAVGHEDAFPPQG